MSQLVRARVVTSGTNANRPASAPVGFQYLVKDGASQLDGQTITVYQSAPMVWKNSGGYTV
ncbi:hypothetical protein KKP06_21990 [Ralstonia pickettii]|uniref:hypothetical protein n=1 Tax=Ralstonia pickettii TaxID=329 RepID=UPI001BE42F32|nr:hypothetical protein [Ralstonia pickettii]MBT2180490.1 hypothetical protein [Ralstonia pickettii]